MVVFGHIFKSPDSLAHSHVLSLSFFVVVGGGGVLFSSISIFF